MSQADLEAALGEVDAICSCMSVERAFIASCDADATFHGEFRSLTSMELVGGGGTTLEKALDLIEEHHLKPDVVIFLTDGQTQWSESRPISLSGARAIVVTPEGAQTGPDWALTLHNGM
jgi:predicted metal-dependent peptidase